MLRLDPDQAEIWESASGRLAGLKTMMGGNLRRDVRDKAARVDMRH